MAIFFSPSMSDFTPTRWPTTEPCPLASMTNRASSTSFISRSSGTAMTVRSRSTGSNCLTRARHHRARRIVEIDRCDAGPFAHVDTLTRRIAEKKMIELRPLDLEGAVVPLFEIAVEMKPDADLAIARQKLSAVLWMKLASRHLIGDAKPREEVVVVRQERLADLKARKTIALEQRHGKTLASQERRSRRTTRPTADYDYVERRRSRLAGDLVPAWTRTTVYRS